MSCTKYKCETRTIRIDRKGQPFQTNNIFFFQQRKKETVELYNDNDGNGNK